MKHRFQYIGLAIFCFIVSHSVGQHFDDTDDKAQKQIVQQQYAIDTVSIIGVGDIMLGTDYPSKSYLPPNDGKNLLDPLKDILQNATVTFGNLEGVLLDGEGTVKTCSDPKICYAFKSPTHYVNYLTEAGFDVLSVANNHVGDFGQIGRESTVNALQQANIAFAGIEKFPYTIFEKDGIKFGFCAFAPNSGTQRINDYKNVRNIVEHLDTICQIVIVSFHGGAEGAKYDKITRTTEMFLGENRGNPYEFARVAIDSGADIVFGHGPHLTRAIDLYKNRFIAYSLGNFATYGRFNLSGSMGIAPIIKVYTNTEGAFIRAEITAIQQKGEGRPTLDPTQKVIAEIQRLTQRDIPECALEIRDNGQILPANR